MSEVQICNRALNKLGADTIQALTDNNTRARVMNLNYASVRDAELRRRRWKFSIGRASLAALADAPAFDFLRQFQLPNDCLRIIEGGDLLSVPDFSDMRAFRCELFTIEGRKILTNLPAPLKVRFIGRITDTALMDPAFQEAFASRLAYESCEKITQSSEKKADCLRDYNLAIHEGTRANALEAAPVSIADDTWVAARAR